MHGLLNLFKPKGITSREALNQIQPLVEPDKIGHAGTLDPMAEGVLLVAVGWVVRLVPQLQDLPKVYEARFILGKTSPTEDTSGEVVDLLEAVMPTEDQLREACAAKVGRIKQRPPSFSAVRIHGRRAHELARKGKKVRLKPREVDIYSIELLEFAPPEFALRVRCGAGTYVRTLGRDIAKALGSDTVMSDLRRTAVGCFDLATAIDPARFSSTEAVQAKLVPAAMGVSHLPSYVVDDSQCELIQRGLSIPIDSFPEGTQQATALTPDGQLLAILVPRREQWGPCRTFPVVNVS